MGFISIIPFYKTAENIRQHPREAALGLGVPLLTVGTAGLAAPYLATLGISSLSTAATAGALTTKQALLLGGGAVAATAIVLGGKQYLEQKQQQTQLAATGGYKIYAYPDSQVTITEPTTGAIKQGQEAAQTATQAQPDYMQWLLIGGLAIAALYVLKKRK